VYCCECDVYWDRQNIGYISVDERLPEEGQEITVIGIPTGGTELVEADIHYWDAVGLVKNITHWKPR
jgi:hypothetical protein